MTRTALLGFALASLSLLHCSGDEQSLGANRSGASQAGSSGSSGQSGAAGEPGGQAGQAGTGTDAGGAAGAAPAARRICDGSDGLTLGYTSGGGGQVEIGSRVLYELGFSFLYVDGHCRFWLIDPGLPQSAWRSVHSGTLTAAQEQQLAADFAYAQWPASHGDSSGSGVSDGGSLVLFDRDGSFSCGQLCQPSTQAIVQSISDHAATWFADLYAQGAPVATPMRARAAAFEPSSAYTPLPWTLSTPLSSLLLDPNDPAVTEHAGDAPLITDPADLAALRQLRADALALPSPGGGPYFYVEQASPALRARVFFRDTLPFEDAHGFVAIP